MSLTRNIRIGIFTLIGLLIIVGFSFYVNDRPYWNKPCKHVSIHVDDATGLRRKSPVRTLGLEIGYIHTVNLAGDKVLIDVCVTAPVKLNADTKAYIKSLGFLGDRFLELKPMDMVDEGGHITPVTAPKSISPTPSETSHDDKKAEDDLKSDASAPIRVLNETKDSIDELEKDRIDENKTQIFMKVINGFYSVLVPSAYAEEEAQVVKENKPLTASRDAEIQDTLKKVGKLIDNLSLMIQDVREVTQQREFKESIVNLNQAMKNLEQLLRPNGKTVANVNSALESFKNSTAQLEDVVRKINNGSGTIGKFVNDPSIFDELKAAVNSINLLLGRAGTLRTFVDMSASKIDAYDGYKARLHLLIAPNPGRYYLIGIDSDPRGRDKKTITTTSVNGSTPSVETKTVNEEKGIRLTAMFGKYFGPLDLRVGILEDAGTVALGFWLDPERRFGIQSEFFSPSKSEPFTARIYGRAQFFSALYVTGGVDQLTRYNGKTPVFYGFGLYFDDDDLKYLLAFK